ncbi:MAG: FAD-dependent oxidoreductase [Acidobacteriota bacterium]
MALGKANVLIAGGGLAGHRIAFALQREARVTLIDPKDYFEVPMAAPRMLVEPQRAEDAIIPYAAFLPHVTHVRGALHDVQPGFVRVGETEIGFDYLVLATGTSYDTDLIKPHAGTAPSRRAHFRQWAERIGGANRILIVGGGPVGVEVAGEILEDRPDRKLTLVHSGPALLPSLTPGPQRYALAFLRQRGAEVILGRPVAGEQADVTLWCAGSRGDTGYLRNYPGRVLDAAGRVLVDPHLRVAGTSNIFAAGDITALPEPKLGIRAGRHAAVVIANLRGLLHGKQSLRVYRPATGSQTMLVTLGRHHGTGHIPFFDFTNSWLARQVKSRDMFIGRYRKGIGLR